MKHSKDVAMQALCSLEDHITSLQHWSLELQDLEFSLLDLILTYNDYLLLRPRLVCLFFSFKLGISTWFSSSRELLSTRNMGYSCS